MSAVVLYATNYETRRIENETRQISSKIERTRRDIAVLKAERALLASPERISEFARPMQLRPAEGDQFVVLPKVGSLVGLAPEVSLPERLR